MTSKEMQQIEQGLNFALRRHQQPNPTGLVNKNTTPQGYVKTRQYVRLSVRRKGAGGVATGPCMDFEHYSSQLSQLGAECEAKKLLRDKGLIHWATLENHQVEL